MNLYFTCRFHQHNAAHLLCELERLQVKHVHQKQQLQALNPCGMASRLSPALQPQGIWEDRPNQNARALMLWINEHYD